MIAIGDTVNALVFPDKEVVGKVVAIQDHFVTIQLKDEQVNTVLSMCVLLNKGENKRV